VVQSNKYAYTNRSATTTNITLPSTTTTARIANILGHGHTTSG